MSHNYKVQASFSEWSLETEHRQLQQFMRKGLSYDDKEMFEGIVKHTACRAIHSHAPQECNLHLLGSDVARERAIYMMSLSKEERDAWCDRELEGVS
jgi:hypothetical protein